jgi:flagellar basal-body rod protein FlgB
VSSIFAAVSSLHQSLDYHLERQNVLASNVAHVDTPGYKPVDLAREVDFAGVLDVTLRRTDSHHLHGSLGGAQSGRVFEDTSAGAGNDGNYVSLDREAAKLAANQLRFDVVSAVASAQLKQLAYAANDAKG